MIAAIAIMAFPIVGLTYTQCEVNFADAGNPIGFGQLENVLDYKASNSPAEATYDDSALAGGCPYYLNISGHMGRYPSSQHVTIDFYSIKSKTYKRSNPALACNKVAHDHDEPPTIDPVAKTVKGMWIACVNHNPPGTPSPPPPLIPGSEPDPEKTKPSPPPLMCERGESSTPHPVFLPTGEKYLEKTDWEDHGPHPLTIKRVYYSGTFRGNETQLWRTWTHNFSQSLKVIARDDFGPTYIRIQTGNAKDKHFIKINGAWNNTNGNDTLENISGGGWLHAESQSEQLYTYDAHGKILKNRHRNGWEYIYTHYNNGFVSSVTNSFGKRINFFYSGYTTSVKFNDQPVVTYESDGEDLHSATYSDGSGEIYNYNSAGFLAEVADSNGNILNSFSYDAQNRVTKTIKPLSVDKYTISYNTNGSVNVKNPIGNDQTFYFFTNKGSAQLSRLSRPSVGISVANRSFDANGRIQTETDFRSNSTSFSWEPARGLLIGKTEAVGTTEDRSTSTLWHPQWRLPVSITKTGREINYAYNSFGNIISKTVKDTAVNPVQSRTWSWTYNASGLVATETMPNGAVSSFSYDSQGNLTQAKNALDQLETYSHDATGRVLTHTSATGLISSFQYDSRGRLARVQRGDQVTVYTYRPTGQLATATAPSGYQVTYGYDAAQRLIGWNDNRGASATYTLDGMGNRVNESITDAQGQTAWKVARTINSLNRIESITAGGTGDTPTSISYGYDENGDVIRSTETVDGATRNTDLGLDALRRVKTITSAQNASAELKYNALDAVTKATDFMGVATNYTRDALGNAKQETSPDAGALTSTYDNLGLPQSITDAMGRASSITRDALGRPTQIVSTLGGATRTTVLRYDLPGAEYNASGAPQASIGTLNEIQDPEVTTRFQRDLQGRITRKTQILASSSLSIGYTYVPAGQNGAGQIASLTYPSGKQLTYAYDTTGRLTGISWAGQPLVSGLEWGPLGQPMAWQWSGFSAGPGSAGPLAEIRSYTSAGQLSGSALLDLTWDSAGRVSRIQQKHMLPGTGAGATAQQATLTSVYTYNPVGRLTASAHSAPAGLALPSGWSLSDSIGPNATGYAWDVNGNRTQAHYSYTATAGTTTLQRVYQATTGTNRLSGYTQTYQEPGSSAQATSLTYVHDASGALTKKGDKHLHYGVDGRIAKAGLSADANQAAMVNYTYNLLSQRLFKSDSRLSSATPVTEQTMYADDSMGSTVIGLYGNRRSAHSAALAGEADSTEVIYLPTASGPMPIATQINGRLYAIDSDHLNTPRRLTNTQGQVAWQWLITGFGEVQPTLGAKGYALNGIDNGRVYSEAVTFNLRYPGQQWDEETQLSYNLNRYYDAQSGRYIQSDPIGLEGGWNRFGYVGGNPIGFADPMGLQVVPITPPVPIPGVPNPSLDAQRDLADRLSRALRDDEETTYQTYTRYNPLTGDCYSGRTSGTGTPEENLKNRKYGQPLLNAEGFLDPVLDRSSTNKNAIRGREQQLIEVNGGARSSGGTSRNMINGISPMNPSGPLIYIPAATSEFGLPVPSGKCTCQ